MNEVSNKIAGSLMKALGEVIELRFWNDVEFFVDQQELDGYMQEIY